MSGDLFDIVQGNRETITGTLHDPAATPGNVLTVQPDGSVAAAPGGGGGGDVTVVVKPVTSAQILDLANTPVVLVPGVPGSVIVVTGLALTYVAGAIPYLDGGPNISVQTGANAIDWTDVAGAGFWDQATDQLMIPQPNVGFGQIQEPVADVDGVDVVLTAAHNPTLGDGTLAVTVAYFLAYASG